MSHSLPRPDEPGTCMEHICWACPESLLSPQVLYSIRSVGSVGSVEGEGAHSIGGTSHSQSSGLSGSPRECGSAYIAAPGLSALEPVTSRGIVENADHHVRAARAVGGCSWAPGRCVRTGVSQMPHCLRPAQAAAARAPDHSYGRVCRPKKDSDPYLLASYGSITSNDLISLGNSPQPRTTRPYREALLTRGVNSRPLISLGYLPLNPRESTRPQLPPRTHLAAGTTAPRPAITHRDTTVFSVEVDVDGILVSLGQRPAARRAPRFPSADLRPAVRPEAPTRSVPPPPRATAPRRQRQASGRHP